MKKLFCQLKKKKDRCCFWEKECHTVAQAGDGESDVLRAGPSWPLRPPCESALPTRLGGQLAWSRTHGTAAALSTTLSGPWENVSPMGIVSHGQLGELLMQLTPDPSFFCKLHLFLDETLSLPSQPDHTLLQLTQKFLFHGLSPGIWLVAMLGLQSQRRRECSPWKRELQRVGEP